MNNCKNRELNKVFTSNRKNKKLQVCVKDKDNKIKNIHFGDSGYEDFTQHRDIKRRASFRARHKCDEADDITTARYWACKELW